MSWQALTQLRWMLPRMASLEASHTAAPCCCASTRRTAPTASLTRGSSSSRRCMQARKACSAKACLPASASAQAASLLSRACGALQQSMLVLQSLGHSAHASRAYHAHICYGEGGKPVRPLVVLQKRWAAVCELFPWVRRQSTICSVQKGTQAAHTEVPRTRTRRCSQNRLRTACKYDISSMLYLPRRRRCSFKAPRSLSRAVAAVSCSKMAGTMSFDTSITVIAISA